VFSLLLGVRGAEASGWSDYQIIMWQKQSADGYRLLQSIGVTTAMLGADRDHPRQLVAEDFRPITDSEIRYYVENIATDFYSAYHRFVLDRPVNWRFLAIEKLYRADPKDPAGLVRDPSLSDPAWLEKISGRLRDTVETNRSYRPLFYNLADEPGIADLNAFWDFDFSQPSLAAMRQWLMSRYASLAALNAEWGSQFASWNAVMPMTTPEAMRQRHGNFSAWADFKAWMDVAFARALAAGRAAVHAADPDAFAGLEGGQKLGWGGYDYATLANSVDVMETEPELFPLVHALNPRLCLLSTSFGSGPVEEHRIWRALLNGGRGIIIWDAKRGFVNPAGDLGERGHAAAPYFKELRDGIGALIINSEEVPGEVAILYSPESLRVQWLLDWKDKGNAWLGRGAGAEDHDDNTVRSAIDAYARALEQLGFAPTYLSPEMIEQGALRHHIRLLVLPHAIALSEAATRAISDFAAAGGAVIADAMPGAYDEHGKRLAVQRLSALFSSAYASELSVGRPSRNENSDPPLSVDAGDRLRLAAVLARWQIEPAIRLSDEHDAAPSDIQLRTFQDGAVTLLALLRDAPVAMPERISAHLPESVYAYDVRQGTLLGREIVLNVMVTGPAPAILALSPHPLPQPTIEAAHSINPGKKLPLRLGFTGPDDAAMHVLHVVVADPLGRTSTEGSFNVIVHGREAEESVPFARDAGLGIWTIEVVDVLSGQKASATVEVVRP